MNIEFKVKVYIKYYVKSVSGSKLINIYKNDHKNSFESFNCVGELYLKSDRFLCYHICTFLSNALNSRRKKLRDRIMTLCTMGCYH